MAYITENRSKLIFRQGRSISWESASHNPQIWLEFECPMWEESKITIGDIAGATLRTEFLLLVKLLLLSFGTIAQSNRLPFSLSYRNFMTLRSVSSPISLCRQDKHLTNWVNKPQDDGHEIGCWWRQKYSSVILTYLASLSLQTSPTRLQSACHPLDGDRHATVILWTY